MSEKKPVSLEEAVETLKKSPKKKFDETVELHIKLGVDASKSDQMVRATVQLPSGSPKEKNIVLLTEDLIKQIKEKGSIEADVVIATPDLMPKVAQVARVLGPQGLMPNPKTGTVTTDPDKTIAELKSGKITTKMDATGNIHEAVGKVSWDADKIVANTKAVLEAVNAARPAAAKGQLIKSVTLASTMSPGIRIDLTA